MNNAVMNNKIAAIQMHSANNLETNLARAGALLAQAAQQNARLAVLPEAFAYLDSPESKQQAVAEADGDGRIQTFLATMAKQHRLWIVGGTVPVRVALDNDKLHSACMLFDDNGKRVATYQKIHLFNVHVAETGESYGEAAIFDAGEQVVVADTPYGRVGFSICYDLRFPELFRLLTDLGAELIVVPSAFTAATGRAHWHSLLRARAIENTVHIIASNQGNRHSGSRDCYGHSMIIDPWGKVLAELNDEEGIAYATPDFKHQMVIRREFPCLDHRVFQVRTTQNSEKLEN